MVVQNETLKIYAGDTLVQAVAEEAGVPTEQVRKTLEAFVRLTKRVAGEGGKVRIQEFGTFYMNHRDEQTGCNPRTGEMVTLPALDRLGFLGTYKYER